jgi:hypothetical protein
VFGSLLPLPLQPDVSNVAAAIAMAERAIKHIRLIGNSIKISFQNALWRHALSMSGVIDNTFDERL